MLLEAAATLDSTCRTAFPNCVSVSSDGQILIQTHSYLHILTPALGLALKVDRSTLSGLPANKTQDQWVAEKCAEAFEYEDDNEDNNEDMSEEEHEDEEVQECTGLNMYKNIISIAKAEVEWSDWTNDPRLAVSGGLENGWRMVSWSPSGLSELGGCILATLDLNRQVSIFVPSNDPLRSTWSQSFSLTNVYLNELLDANPELAEARGENITLQQRREKEGLVMQAQATSISWSPPAPSYAVRDDSILAVGARSGDITFWRYDGSSDMRFLNIHRAAKLWPLVLAWSEWTTVPSSANITTNTTAAAAGMDGMEVDLPEIGQEAPAAPESQPLYSIFLAVACSAGPVRLLRITTLQDASLKIEDVGDILPSPKTVTCMKFLSTGELVIGRLGELSIWSLPKEQKEEGSTAAGKLRVNIKIPMEQYKGYTSIPHPIEVSHLQDQDTLLVTLTDGTFRLIKDFSTSPSLVSLGAETSASSSTSSSVVLNNEIRRSFLALERASTSKKGASVPLTSSMQISGLYSFNDASCTCIWEYERIVKDVKVYNMAVMHKTTLAVGRLFDRGLKDKILRDVRSLLLDPEDACMTSSSLAVFPLFLSMRHLHNVEDLARDIYNILVESLDLKFDFATNTQSAEDKHAIHSFIWQDKKLQAIRLGGLIAVYWAKNSAHPETRDLFASLVTKITTHVYAVVFSNLLRLLELHNITNNLLYTRYKQIIASIEDSQSDIPLVDAEGNILPPRPAEVMPSELDQIDTCAACGEIVPFTSLTRATCRNGHEWLRCSITLSVLSTISARTCMVCSRKTRLPSVIKVEEGSAQEEDEKAEETVLALAKHCVFCGGRWTKGR